MSEEQMLKTIVLVDDDPDILLVAELALVNVGGFEVESFLSSQEAVAQARSINPDLIILDMMMPDIDGMKALQMLRGFDQLDQVPIVFMTAKVQKNEIQTYLDAGAAGVIQKPFDPMKLAEKVTNIWKEFGDIHG